jgi:hypothetical protein
MWRLWDAAGGDLPRDFHKDLADRLDVATARK